jgi:hypothetical protein
MQITNRKKVYGIYLMMQQSHIEQHMEAKKRGKNRLVSGNNKPFAANYLRTENETNHKWAC